MGKSQRQKGNRGEYQLRDELRRFGYKADRVPASGAAQGFKGDIHFSKDGRTWVAEMKSRKNSFASIYALFAAHYNAAKDDTLKLVLDDGRTLVSLSSSPVGALEEGGCYDHAKYLGLYADHARAIKRLPTLQKMMKDCDMLAIKDNQRPLLYLRFR